MTGPAPFWQSPWPALLGRGGLHRGVPVAEHDRARSCTSGRRTRCPSMSQTRAPRPPPHELRVGGARGGLVPVHPARDHGLRPLAAAAGRCSCGRRLTVHQLLDPAGRRPAARRAEEVQAWARLSIPASEPRPVATREPQATPSQAASCRARLLEAASPASIPAVKPSPQPVVSTTSTGRAGRRPGALVWPRGDQAAVRALGHGHAAGAQRQMSSMASARSARPVRARSWSALGRNQSAWPSSGASRSRSCRAAGVQHVDGDERACVFGCCRYLGQFLAGHPGQRVRGADEQGAAVCDVPQIDVGAAEAAGSRRGRAAPGARRSA